MSAPVSDRGEALAAIDRIMAERDRLREALSKLLVSHVRLVASGDCGNWDVETEAEVIAARAVLAGVTPAADSTLRTTLQNAIGCLTACEETLEAYDLSSDALRDDIAAYRKALEGK